MVIGFPREINNHEYRVGLLPVHVHALRAAARGTGNVLEIANKGWRRASAENAAIRSGLNVVEGGVTLDKIAEQFRLPLNQP